MHLKLLRDTSISIGSVDKELVETMTDAVRRWSFKRLGLYMRLASYHAFTGYYSVHTEVTSE